MRAALLILAIVTTTALCHAQQKPVPVQPPSSPAPGRADRAAILADSEVRYVESGGIAGYTTDARLKAGDGRISIDYHPPQSRAATPPFSGTLTDAEYLDLWKTLEENKVWSLDVPGKRLYPDMIRHELTVRLGERSHQIVWLEADASPAVQTAITLAAAIRKTAEQGALLR